MTTEILGLDEILASQSQKEVAHNTALRQIEGRLVRALSRALAAPPSSPAEGDSYIVAASPTGAWSGQAGKIAHFFGGAWKFWQPIEGIRLWVNDEDKVYAWDGAAWVVSGGDGVSLSAVNVFTKNQSVAVAALGSGASPAIDASLSNNFKITLGANNTLVNPTNLTEGMILNFALTQDATGSRTLSYGSLYKFPGGAAPALSTAANAKDFMSCYYDGAVLLCQMNKGFA